ncbi:MAG TPA: SNF2-related protein, partial [Allocoleopsis sp.]
MFLIRSLAKKITSLLSGVRIPRQYQRDDWYVECPYSETKIFQIASVSISDNYCLIISTIKISDNLLPVVPEIFEKSELLQRVKIYELEEQLFFAIPEIFEKNSLVEIDPTNSYNRTDLIPEIETFSYDKISLSSLIILNSLFESLLEPSIKGKVFNKEIKTNNVNNIQPIARIRKAYSPGKALSPWDLLYPSLCPPLLFDFSEELNSLNRLRGYQKEGVTFLVKHPSALLADEMGTGKTVQTVNAVRILFRLAKISC